MPAVHRNVPYVADPFLYRQHYGGAIPVLRGTVHQDGYGLGSLFGSVLRSVLPALKSTAVSAGKTLLRSGAQAMGDIVSGERSVKDSRKGYVRAENSGKKFYRSCTKQA